jgi:hypothetical protein
MELLLLYERGGIYPFLFIFDKPRFVTTQDDKPGFVILKYKIHTYKIEIRPRD